MPARAQPLGQLVAARVAMSQRGCRAARIVPGSARGRGGLRAAHLQARWQRLPLEPGTPRFSVVGPNVSNKLVIPVNERVLELETSKQGSAICGFTRWESVPRSVQVPKASMGRGAIAYVASGRDANLDAPLTARGASLDRRPPEPQSVLLQPHILRDAPQRQLGRSRPDTCSVLARPRGHAAALGPPAGRERTAPPCQRLDDRCRAAGSGPPAARGRGRQVPQIEHGRARPCWRSVDRVQV
jgi:hypothetical protein